MRPQMSFKRGSTFHLVGSLPISDVNDNRVNLTGWNIASQIRKLNGDLVANLTATINNPIEQTITISSLGTTQNWPVGRVKWDLRITDPEGTIIYTNTVIFDVIDPVTFNE